MAETLPRRGEFSDWRTGDFGEFWRVSECRRVSAEFGESAWGTLRLSREISQNFRHYVCAELRVHFTSLALDRHSEAAVSFHSSRVWRAELPTARQRFRIIGRGTQVPDVITQWRILRNTRRADSATSVVAPGDGSWPYLAEIAGRILLLRPAHFMRRNYRPVVVVSPNRARAPKIVINCPDGGRLA